MKPLVLADLAVNLSPTASLWVSIDPDAIWDMPSMLLAQQVDQVAVLLWGLGGGKGPRPEPIPRPGVKPDVQVLGSGDGFDTIEEFADWYAEQRAAMVPASG